MIFTSFHICYLAYLQIHIASELFFLSWIFSKLNAKNGFAAWGWERHLFLWYASKCVLCMILKKPKYKCLIRVYVDTILIAFPFLCVMYNTLLMFLGAPSLYLTLLTLPTPSPNINFELLLSFSPPRSPGVIPLILIYLTKCLKPPCGNLSAPIKRTLVLFPLRRQG